MTFGRRVPGSIMDRMWRHGRSARGRAEALWRDRSGLSAVEFALLAPILFTGLLTTVDIGLAVAERMNLDHALRAAAQGAMTGQKPEEILMVLKGIASVNFAAAGQSAGTNAVELSVTRECACAEKLSVLVGCSVTCSASAMPLPYLRLTARKTYDGMIIPPIRFERSITVQAR
jgi:pilus assembly protein CpaE